MILPRLSLLALCSVVSVSAFGAPSDHAPTPPPVKFSREVLPIFAHRCFECHGNGKRKGDLDMTTRESVLKGGKDGPAIVIGKGGDSEMIRRVTSSDPDERMPNKGDPLARDEIATLKAWIDQGA